MALLCLYRLPIQNKADLIFSFENMRPSKDLTIKQNSRENPMKLNAQKATKMMVLNLLGLYRNAAIHGDQAFINVFR